MIPDYLIICSYFIFLRTLFVREPKIFKMGGGFYEG